MKIEYAVEYGGEWQVVEGDLLPEIAPHLAHAGTFAIGRSHGIDRYWWIVTNLETGFRCAYSRKKKEAIEKAHEKLETKTAAILFGRYRAALNKSKPLSQERSHR